MRIRIYGISYHYGESENQDNEITLEIECAKMPPIRARWREHVKLMMRNLWPGSQAHVWFEDECPDCGRELQHSDCCTNPNCISSPDFVDSQ